MKPTSLFHFTPSLLPSETLEALFVQREPLAQRLLDFIRESATTESKHFSLLVGPRGIGKTHLLALIYHRVTADAPLADRLRIAWLREEEWGVDSFLDLLLRICRALREEYGQAFPAEALEPVYEQETRAAEQTLQALIRDFVGERTLLLMTENLDDLFAGMKDKGQRQLRAWLQEGGFSTLLATSQSLFADVSQQRAPFFGFFNVQTLKVFDVDDAMALLKNIALMKEDRALAAFIDTPAGRARVRTIDHLASGNPRVYVIFSSFLTRESLDSLVEPFLSTLDELTPYYQARIHSLSLQQRKIVEFLCDHAAPATVKEIAKRCRITSQTASGQLKALKERGYVLSDPLGPTGRDTYYELREPLMRLCLNVKKSRGGPVDLLVEFLRLWYLPKELERQLDACKPDTPMEREYLQKALALASESPDPRVMECNKALHKHLIAGEMDQLLEVAEELVAIEPTSFHHYNRGAIRLLRAESDEAIEDFDVAIALAPTNPYPYVQKGLALIQAECYEQAEQVLKESLPLFDDDDLIYKLDAWVMLVDTLVAQDKDHEAVDAIDQAMKSNVKGSDFWIQMGQRLLQLGDADESYRLPEKILLFAGKAVRADKKDARSWVFKARVLFRLGRHEESVVACDTALTLDHDHWRAWLQKEVAFSRLGRYGEALSCVEQAMRLNPDWDCLYYDKAEAQIGQGNYEEGTTSLAHALVTHTLEHDHLLRHTAGVLRSLTRNDVVEWQSMTANLTSIYADNNSVDVLAIALVGSVVDVFVPEFGMPVAKAQAWYEAWKSAAGDIPEFELPLRVFDVALRYSREKDKRILLELPAEERTALTKLFKVEVEAQ